MKRATTILLAALLAASLTACGVVGDESSAPASGAASEAAASEAEVSESTAPAEESAPAESPLSDFEFAENDTGMTVVKYLGDAEHVIIPAAVDGKPVTEIGDYAFSDEKTFTGKDVTTVEIPTTVTIIREGAFTDCLKLQTINLPQGLTEIGDHAFIFCTRLFNVNLPNTLLSLGRESFAYCTSLTHITIPASIREWGIRVFESSALETVIFEEGLEQIGDYCFAGVKLKEIVFPESLKK